MISHFRGTKFLRIKIKLDYCSINRERKVYFYQKFIEQYCFTRNENGTKAKKTANWQFNARISGTDKTYLFAKFQIHGWEHFYCDDFLPSLLTFYLLLFYGIKCKLLMRLDGLHSQNKSTFFFAGKQQFEFLFWIWCNWDAPVRWTSMK